MLEALDSSIIEREVISRDEAIARRLVHYFTGVACCQGHLSERSVKTKNCAECNRQSAKRFRTNNPDLVKGRKNESRKRNLVEERARDKARYNCERDRKVKYQRQYRLLNLESVRRKTKEWERRNPGKVRAAKAKVRANRRKAPGSFTADDATAIRKAQRDRCAYCKEKLNGGGHLDHIVSLSKGGSNWPRNLQWLCIGCNLSKHNKDPIDFAQRKGLLL